jgi:hypothetical protein
MNKTLKVSEKELLEQRIDLTKSVMEKCISESRHILNNNNDCYLTEEQIMKLGSLLRNYSNFRSHVESFLHSCSLFIESYDDIVNGTVSNVVPKNHSPTM